MKEFLKKALVFSIISVFASVDCFASDGWCDHDYDHHDHDHDYDHHDYDHGGWWGGGRSGRHQDIDDYDDIGESYEDSENGRRTVIDTYTQRINASRDRHNSELVQWRDEYPENQRLIGEMSQQITTVAREDRRSRDKVWSDYLSSSVETGNLVFFRSPATPAQRGLFITLVSKEQFRVLGDWTQHAALIVQHANETNGQALFVHLARKEEEDITWWGYNHMQEVGGLQMVLGNLVFPQNGVNTVPYSPFMTWCVEPTQPGWQRAYNTYQELLNQSLSHLGRKDCSYSTRGASYGRGLFSGWGRERYWKGSHNCVTYCSMILEKFGVITKTDLVNDKLSTASFKTQLGRRLIMRDHSSGILLSRGEEDFQGEGGARVHPWVTMNVGLIIGELIREDSTEVS